LPNQQPASPAEGYTATRPRTTADGANIAPASKPAPREPRPFIPAANISTMPNPGLNTQTSIKPQTPAARAVAAARGSARPAPRQAAPRQNSYANRLWQSVNVAFQQPSEWDVAFQPEEMPIPGGPAMGPMHGPYDPMMGDCSDGSCSPHGQGGCGCGTGGCGESCGCGCAGGCGEGMCGCGMGAGCGGACEPGCGCEPSCGCGSGSCGSGGCCDNGLCIGWGDHESCHTIRVRVPKWQEFTVFGGVQGFKGPYDQDRDSGNFGFHEGLNVGFKMPYSTMGYQIGYRAVHSQLSGDKDEDISDPHTQQFVTAGIFQRAKDGIQGGVVWDMLRDERWGAVDFHQLRGELSLIDRGCHEIGVSVAVHLNDHEIQRDNDDFTTFYQATDQYLLFYRFHGVNGGEGRFFGGFNDDSDGIIGADVLLPLHDRWSMAAGFTYLIPDESGGSEGASQEAWNVGLGLVWHWDCRARKSHNNCYRPLFNVADNGYLIIDDRAGAEVD
jgi:hypothetical protein